MSNDIIKARMKRAVKTLDKVNNKLDELYVKHQASASKVVKKVA